MISYSVSQNNKIDKTILITEQLVMQRFKNARQSHVFESYDSLSEKEKKMLIKQASEIDLCLLHDVANQLLPISKPTTHTSLADISPPEPIKLPEKKMASKHFG